MLLLKGEKYVVFDLIVYFHAFGLWTECREWMNQCRLMIQAKWNVRNTFYRCVGQNAKHISHFDCCTFFFTPKSQCTNYRDVSWKLASNGSTEPCLWEFFCVQPLTYIRLQFFLLLPFSLSPFPSCLWTSQYPWDTHQFSAQVEMLSASVDMTLCSFASKIRFAFYLNTLLSLFFLMELNSVQEI